MMKDGPLRPSVTSSDKTYLCAIKRINSRRCNSEQDKRRQYETYKLITISTEFKQTKLPFLCVTLMHRGLIGTSPWVRHQEKNTSQLVHKK